LKRFNRNRRSHKKDNRNPAQEGSLSNIDPNSLSLTQQRMPGREKNLPERPRWTAPKPLNLPLPVLHCIRCGQLISDAHAALADRKGGEPVHFDCVLAELLEKETLEKGESLSYIGGGRFGIVEFNGRKGESSYFTIKKIVEWEDKENRAPWRNTFADNYSLT